ncbi:hypothetical protein [Pantoea rwandensis]|nr:hypothetical protein [Pantoea rwandensis]
MGKKSIAAWFFLLVSLGSCAQLPNQPLNLSMHQGRHLDVNNSTADVAETPDEHIQERLDDAGHQQ